MRIGRAKQYAAFLSATTILLVATGCPLEPFDVPFLGCEDVVCDDENPCTRNRCDETTGECVFELFVCNDDNPCTLDMCHDESESCLFEPMKVNTLCEDDDACNGIETCNAEQQCSPGPPTKTDDDDECTTDSCDPKTGEVSHAPIAGCGVAWDQLATSGAPPARRLHTAVWTGNEMIVWGGRDDAVPTTALNTGARYDPATDTWSAVNETGAPEGRHSHSAVWTGEVMLVWGGFGTSDYLTDGAAYDPETDSWIPIASSGAPSGRTLHSTTWTGSEMIVWGGLKGVAGLKTGARYNPKSDTWAPVKTNGSPSQRFLHAAVWAGSELVIWGGTDTFDWLGNGKFYKPGSNSWTDAINTNGAPRAREDATAVWTGSQVLIWGGNDGGVYLNDGALLDVGAPNGGSWTAMNDTQAPSPRYKHKSVWTGQELIVWGGCGGMSCGELYDDGGVWQSVAAGNSWSKIAGNNGLSKRTRHSIVWTGQEVIVWGGSGDDEALGNGGRATIARLLAR